MTKKELLKKIGKNIQNCRKEKGYTQESFAEKMNLSWSYISKIEAGFLNLSCGKIYDIAAALGVDVSVIFKV